MVRDAAYFLTGSAASAIGAIWLGLGFDGGLVAFLMFPAFALTGFVPRWREP